MTLGIPMSDYYAGFLDPWMEGYRGDFNPYILETTEWRLWEDGHAYRFETSYPCYEAPKGVHE